MIYKTAFFRLAHFRKFQAFSTMPLKVGDKLPSVNLFENAPDKKVNIAELCAGKKAVIFALPGAFTPGCSKTHLPGYIENFDNLKSKGVDIIACITVNDPFVVSAWGEQHGAGNKIRMLADPRAEFTKAVGMELDLTAVLGTVRSKRYSMIVEDNVVKAINVEADGTGLTCSLAKNIVDNL